jgi:hypothetical protein
MDNADASCQHHQLEQHRDAFQVQEARAGPRLF